MYDLMKKMIETLSQHFRIKHINLYMRYDNALVGTFVTVDNRNFVVQTTLGGTNIYEVP